jgi:hypothetical protein
VGFFICATGFASDLLGNILWQKKYKMSPPVSAGTDILWHLPEKFDLMIYRNLLGNLCQRIFELVFWANELISF